MSETGFTKGPWEARGTHPYESKDGTVTVDMDAPICDWSIWREYRDEQGRRNHRPVAQAFIVQGDLAAAEANAHLIAAAPTMYEELKRTLELATKQPPLSILDAKQLLRQIATHARAALSKAEGR